MKNKTKLILLASILTACALGVTRRPNNYGATASERLRNNAQHNRNFVAIFANAGLPVVAARFQGRAEAMEEIADLIDAGELQTGTIQGPN
jgi:methionine synthase I (cobalamin-dependent)